MFFLSLAVLTSASAFAGHKDVKIINEIKILKNRLTKQHPIDDQEQYENFCKDNGFANQCNSSHYLYKKLSNEELLAYDNYLSSLYQILEKKLPTTRLITNKKQTIISKIKAAIDQALIGDALGFLIENESTIAEMKEHFPNGVVDISSVSDSLKANKLSTKYGKYNNNNLNHLGKIIYSDDTEMSLLTLYSALKSYKKDQKNIDLIMGDFSKNLAIHWYLNLKLSGKYGEDGLYYGMRGYGKKSLESFSDIYHNKLSDKSNLNNGSLISSWIFGLMPYENYQIASEIAFNKSLITNKSYEVATSCAVMAAAIHIAIYDMPRSKIEIVDKMIEVALLFENKYSNQNPLTSTYLKYAKLAALEDINPVLFYNSNIGYYAPETTAAVVFCFLRHEYFLTSLIESIHIPGDSDSVANLSSALMGAYFGIKSFPKEYQDFIEVPSMTLRDDIFGMNSLIDEILANIHR
ncbi:ADP-ribosylglycohydrolase [Candidatus Arcanobacter lacustris]|uniref:ADP-ribosylglycohydrolase n=1 Tax=Candidatus Arcanibacter lacustris TaxID=1607817 RepID=A0A0F5MR05_9RICK|nr:ADP-ribosylglycohydrolase [Candidatus Arcanobacter lacustris]